MEQVLAALLSSRSGEWYTPPCYVEAARQVMGGEIDLDPASSQAANQVIKAATFFEQATDGLNQPWYGRVWLNPPYGKSGSVSNQELWTRKLIAEYQAGHVTQAILLVNFVPGYRWFSPLWDYPICSVDHCIRFLRADGKPAGSAKASRAFIYFGLADGEAGSVRFRFADKQEWKNLTKSGPHTPNYLGTVQLAF